MANAVSIKQNEITKLQQEIQAAGNLSQPGAEPARYGWGYNRTNNRTFEYGTAYQIGKGDANTDNPVTRRYPLGNKAAIANDVRKWLANANKPHDDWKAATQAYQNVDAKKKQLAKAQQELVQLEADAAQQQQQQQQQQQAQQQQNIQQLQQGYATTFKNLVTDPAANVTQATVSNIDPNAAGTQIAQGTGQAPNLATQYSASTVGTTAQAAAPDPLMQASLVNPSMSQQGISNAMRAVNPAQGTLSPQAMANAAQMNPSQTQVGNLQAAQGQAIMMNNPVQRQIQAGELISGSADAQTAATFTEQIQEAQATPTQQATVQGQLASMTANFDATNPPSWAAGALRGATAAMAARGLGASSMAGQALGGVGKAGKFVWNQSGRNTGERVMRLAPDAFFGGMAAMQTPGDLGDKLIAGGTQAIGSVGLGLGASKLPGIRGTAMEGIADMAGSVAGDFAGMYGGDALLRAKGGGTTPWEKVQQEGNEQMRAELEQQLLAQYGLAGHRPHDLFMVENGLA